MVISISNGLINAFYMCPINRINGQIKEASHTKYQRIIMAIEYLGKAVVVIISGLMLDGLESKYVALIGMIIYTISTIVFAFTYKENKSVKNLCENKNGPTLNNLNLDCDSIEVDNKTINNNEEIPHKKFNPFRNY